MKDISIIIINYNTASYTLKCVESIKNNTHSKLTYDIIVVDNNSEINDYTHLKENFPKANHIYLRRSVINTGFGAGNMFGFQFSKSRYTLFLNNDAMLMNDGLTLCYDYMQQHPKAGVCTAQNYDENNKHVISFDHHKGIIKLLFGRGLLEKINPEIYPKRKKEYLKPVNVNYVNGAFMFFRTDIFCEVGGFDTSIFLYFEEMDICTRLKRKGYDSVLLPQAKISHYQGASTGISKLMSIEAQISYLYVIKKNYSYLKYLFIRFYLSVTFIFKPKKWFLLPLILKGGPVSKSLKTKQKIRL